MMKTIIKAVSKKHGKETEDEILNKIDKNGQSALFLASSEAHAAVVDWLINEKKACLGMRSCEVAGLTPLHAAAAKNLKVTKLLLETSRLSPKEKRDYLLAKCHKKSKAVDYAKEKKHLEIIEVLHLFFSFLQKASFFYSLSHTKVPWKIRKGVGIDKIGAVEIAKEVLL